jgi:Cu(I)/Ag(I) efflux system membrane fusion protein
MKHTYALCVAALFLALGCSHTKPEPPVEVTHPANPAAPEAAETVPTAYTCPEHPRVMQAEPGECPICGAKLVPSESRNTSPLRGVTPQEGHQHQ